MATLSQIGAVTGRRIRPRYAERINAMTPYLPNIYAQKQQSEYQDKLISLENKKLAQTERLAEEENRLAEKSIKQQKKDARTGTYLSALSTVGQLGIGGLKWKTLADALAGGGGGTTPAVGSSIPGGIDLGIGTGGMDAGAGGGLMGGITGALGKSGTWAGAGVGTLAGSMLGGKDAWKGALIGGGAGAFTNWLSGGDLTSMIMSGMLGGIGGAIF